MLLSACASVPAPGAAGRLMAVLDADGDARLSAEEFASVAHPAAQLSAADTNKDNLVDVHELDALLRETGPLLPDHAKRLLLPPPATASLDALDVNHDGALLPAEWPGEGFAAADVDADGRVLPAELGAWLDTVRAVKP